MKEKYLVINAGSSSLKFSLNEIKDNDFNELVSGIVEKIGEDMSIYSLKGKTKIEKEGIIKDHTQAVSIMLKELLDNNYIEDLSEIKGVGHRVLHGGELYSESVEITDEVLENIKSLEKLGPLHIPGEVSGIESMKKLLPNITQVAVFDTAYHQTMPKENYMYAVPYEWYETNGVRKYGFHGTSHNYIADQMKKYYNKDDLNLIICHIGSGASISCIKNGKCVNTTMGLTPLDGLMMGTRSGAIDPSIVEYICKEKNMSVEEVNTALNKKGGLLGISGKNDLRDVETLANNGDEKAKLAIRMFEKSIEKSIAEYYFELNGDVNAIVFTAGVGESGINVRKQIITDIAKPMNISFDELANSKIARGKEYREGKISKDSSSVDVFVIPTNEEYMILKDTYNIEKSKENSKQKVKEL